MTELYHLLADEYDHPLKRWMYGHYHALHHAVYDGMMCRLLDINEVAQLPAFDHFGALEELMKKYRSGDCDCDELETLAAKRMISRSEWIEAQSEKYPDYAQWLKANGLRRNNSHANQYLKERNTHE